MLFASFFSGPLVVVVVVAVVVVAVVVVVVVVVVAVVVLFLEFLELDLLSFLESGLDLGLQLRRQFSIALHELDFFKVFRDELDALAPQNHVVVKEGDFEDFHDVVHAKMLANNISTVVAKLPQSKHKRFNQDRDTVSWSDFVVILQKRFQFEHTKTNKRKEIGWSQWEEGEAGEMGGMD